MMTPLKLAIIGVGHWGTQLLRNFLAQPEVEVVAIADTCPQRLQAARARFALPSTVQWFDSGEQAIGRGALQAVVIATPASTHQRLIHQALKRGLHVLCEKPLTLNSAACRGLCRLARVHNRQLMVDHTYLFHPAVQRGYSFCHSDQGKVWRYGHGARTNLGPVRQDVDVCWDLAIHDVSILNYWLGHGPVAVAAWGQAWLQQRPGAAVGLPVRDVGWMRLTYPSHIEVLLHVSWLNPDKQRRLALVGDQGTLVLDELMHNGALTWYPGQVVAQGQSWVPRLKERQILDVATVEPLAQMVRHFVDCIRCNISSEVSSGDAALGLIELMEATQTALETGQTVAL